MRGKYLSTNTAKGIGAKVIVGALALVLIFCGVAGGTAAWLTAASDPVVNTFTYGDINITLKETDTKLDGDTDPNTNAYAMIPGQSITKDPKVTVLQGSEACWLFIKLEESENFADFMVYEVAQGWEPLLDETGEQVKGVYYRTAEAVADDKTEEFTVLKDNKVTVKDTVTKEDLNALDPAGQEASYPKLTVTAYAVQYAGLEPEVTEGAQRPTQEQIRAAAAKVWQKIAGPETAEP